MTASVFVIAQIVKSCKQHKNTAQLLHIINGDLEEKNFLKHIIYSFTRRVFGIGNKTEYKADAYAVRHVGKTSSLNSMYELLSVKGHQLSRIEMEERIKRIKEGKY